MKKPHESMNKPHEVDSAIPTEDASLLNKMNALVEEFERLLASELHLLKSGRGEGLEAIANAKQSLIEAIAKQEPNLFELFEAEQDNDDVQSLKRRLMQCRTENRNNYALVMLELKHTNKSLELLRSVLRMDDLSLYSEQGKVRINREKRKFGSA